MRKFEQKKKLFIHVCISFINVQAKNNDKIKPKQKIASKLKFIQLN